MLVARLLIRPWVIVRVIASTIALLTNAMQLSEMSDPLGVPLETSHGYKGKKFRAVDSRWASMAENVAFEAYQIRRHLGVVK